VDRQRTAIDVPPARRGLLLSGGVVLRRGVCRRERLFHVFQHRWCAPSLQLGVLVAAVPLRRHRHDTGVDDLPATRM
jgi:hypothetical protein